MNIISGTPADAAKLIADRISQELSEGNKVLWLLPGGSNIQIAAEAMKLVRSRVAPDALARLSGILTDERYGDVGHKDSNWGQLPEAGFDFAGMGKAVPVLTGVSLDETVANYEKNLKELASDANVVIGQFGMGTDSHIAGALPDSPAIESRRAVVAYEAPGFTRITLTVPALKTVDVAFLSVFGASKKEAVQGIAKKSFNVNKKPAAVVWAMKEAYLVSDQL